MSSTTHPAPATLTQHIQALPQELIDMIFDRVLAIPEVHALIVTATYKPPSILQVDSHSRQRVAAAYYGSPQVSEVDIPVKDALRWTIALPKHHRDLIKRIHISDGIGAPSITPPRPRSPYETVANATARASVIVSLHDRGVHLGKTVLEVTSRTGLEWGGISVLDMMS